MTFQGFGSLSGLMSLPYKRRSLQDTLAALDRRGSDLSTLVLTAWEDRTGFHADPGCSPSTQPLELSLGEWVKLQAAAPRGFSCTCGGVLGVPAGSLLGALSLTMQALDAERVSYVAKSWAEADAWFALAKDPVPMHRLISPALSVIIGSLPEDISLAADRIAKRSVAALPLREIHESVAAQGVLVPVRPALGSFLEQWATRHLDRVTFNALEPSSSPRSDRNNSTPLFDSALASALADTDHRVLVVAVHEVFRNTSNAPAVRLARMLLRVASVDESLTLACISLPVGLADGLHALLSRPGLSVECGTVPLSEVVVELACRLWEPSERGPLSRLDGAVAAARLLESDRV